MASAPSHPRLAPDSMTSSTRGKPYRANAEDRHQPHGEARYARPTIAALAVSTPLSTIRYCNSRPRGAPSALRMAISRPRLSARAMSRFMALAQAISNTQPTAARTMSSVEPASPTTRAFGIPVGPHVAFSSWYSDFQDTEQARVGGAQRVERSCAGNLQTPTPDRHREERSLSLGDRPPSRSEHRDVLLEWARHLLQHPDHVSAHHQW